MDPARLRFFNPPGAIRQTKNRLPHWQQTGAVYFVTFRLADAVPQQLRERWMEDRETWLVAHPEPRSAEEELEYHKRFSGAIERWLDAGYGACVLRQPECREVVANALLHFDGERLALISFVVMPNHVHALFAQHRDWSFEKLLRSWKSFTTRRINEVLGRSGPLWQPDYFDRLVRDEAHFRNCVRYVRWNPERAGLRKEEFTLWESTVALAVLAA